MKKFYFIIYTLYIIIFLIINIFIFIKLIELLLLYFFFYSKIFIVKFLTYSHNLFSDLFKKIKIKK